MYKETTGS